MSPSLSSAAARDDVYDLTELAFAHRSDRRKLAKIAQALEDSIPRLDPVRFKSEIEHVLTGPDVPELALAKDMARAALDGRPLPPSSAPTADEASRRPGGLLSRTTGLLRGRPAHPRD